MKNPMDLISNKFSRVFLTLGVLLFGGLATAQSQEKLIDAIVATVNGVPISIRDVESRLSTPRRLVLEDMERSLDAKMALDLIIQEELIRAEASSRNLAVSKGELDRYLAQIAGQNNFSEEELNESIRNEYGSVEKYKRQIELDILKNKLAGALFRGGVSVTDKEVREFLESRPKAAAKGNQVRLRQIFLSTFSSDRQKALEQLKSFDTALSSGKSFDQVAKEAAKATGIEQGQDLGLVAEKDLHPKVFDEVFSLKEGESSDIVETPAGFHIFLVEQRVSDSQEDSDSEDEWDPKEFEAARVELQQRGLQDRLSTYFDKELFELHAVEKKI